MQQRKVSKNTKLVSNGNFEDISFRPLNNIWWMQIKVIKITFLYFVNQLHEKNNSLLICGNYVGPSASMR